MIQDTQETAVFGEIPRDPPSLPVPPWVPPQVMDLDATAEYLEAKRKREREVQVSKRSFLEFLRKPKPKESPEPVSAQRSSNGEVSGAFPKDDGLSF